MSQDLRRIAPDALVSESLAPALIYDADCGFCTRSARWLERHFADPTARIVSWKEFPVERLGLSKADVTSAAWWVGRDGEVSGAHLSIAHAMKAGTGVVHVGGVILGKPPVSWLAAPVYRVIARRRHQMPGGTDSCAL